MTEHVKSGTQLQGKSFKYLKDTRMWCMQSHSTILMGMLSQLLKEQEPLLNSKYNYVQCSLHL